MTFRAMLDTNIMSTMMRQGAGRLWQHVERFGTGNICVSAIATAELRYGAEFRRSPRLHAEIDEILTVIRSVPFEAPADAIYGSIRTHLRLAGTPIGGNDLFIAAHALALDLTLVTANVGEFSRVPNLKIENWLD